MFTCFSPFQRSFIIFHRPYISLPVGFNKEFFSSWLLQQNFSWNHRLMLPKVPEKNLLPQWDLIKIFAFFLFGSRWAFNPPISQKWARNMSQQEARDRKDSSCHIHRHSFLSASPSQVLEFQLCCSSASTTWTVSRVSSTSDEPALCSCAVCAWADRCAFSPRVCSEMENSLRQLSIIASFCVKT